jgi:hypothetical protein
LGTVIPSILIFPLKWISGYGSGFDKPIILQFSRAGVLLGPEVSSVARRPKIE